MRTSNIRLTFQSVIGESLTVATRNIDGSALNLTVPVHHENVWADPDSMGDPKEPPERAWVELAWLEEGAGRRGVSVVQVDVYNRIGQKGALDSDPHGIIVDDIADEIEERFSGVRPDGTYRGWIPVLDFAVPQAPVPAGNCIFVWNPGAESSWGQVTSRRRIMAYDGFQRVSMTYTLRLTTDATPGAVPNHG